MENVDLSGKSKTGQSDCLRMSSSKYVACWSEETKHSAVPLYSMLLVDILICRTNFIVPTQTKAISALICGNICAFFVVAVYFRLHTQTEKQYN